MFSILMSNSRVICRNFKQYGLLPLLKEENGGVLSLNQVRPYAARKGKRAALAAAKREKKLADANKKTTEIPKFLPKKKQQLGKQRWRVADENWLEVSITDDIWRTKFCRGKPYPVNEAISMLEELHDPTMLNDPQAFVYTTVELDLRLKKKNQYMQEFTGTVLYPHNFETGSANRVIALCENSDDQFRASSVGAVYVGGVSLIKRIQKLEIASEDFDYVVCHLDLLKDVNKIRGILKGKFPSVKNGLLTTHIDQSVAEFMKCTEYTASASSVEPDFGWIDVCFGRLNMSHEKLQDNLKEILNTIEEKHKPLGVENQPFITRTVLWCSKSAEKFKIPHWEYLPDYPLNGVVVQSEDTIAD